MGRTKRAKASTQIGKWRINRTLGTGGNGVVYLVTDGVSLFALKTLIRFAKTIDYSRFKDEIGDSDERDHHIPAQADHPFRGKLTRAFRGKLTTPNA